MSEVEALKRRCHACGGESWRGPVYRDFFSVHTPYREWLEFYCTTCGAPTSVPTLRQQEQDRAERERVLAAPLPWYLRLFLRRKAA